MSRRKSPTRTPALLAANGRNPQKSIRARTRRGKAWSRLNAQGRRSVGGIRQLQVRKRCLVIGELENKEGSLKMPEYPVICMKTKTKKFEAGDRPVILLKTNGIGLQSCYVDENKQHEQLKVAASPPRFAEGLRPSGPKSPCFPHPQLAGGAASGELRMRLGVTGAFRAGGASPHSKRRSRGCSVHTDLPFWTRVR